MKSDTTEANRIKKAQATANRERIARAIVTLKQRNQQVTVSAVAREAGVSPDTVRRSGDSYEEIKKHRDDVPSLRRGSPPVSAQAHQALKARLMAAQAEVSELKNEVRKLQRVVHQTLGTSPGAMDPVDAEEMRQENAELAVLVGDLRRQVSALQDERANLAEELTAAHDVSRGYVRELTAAQERLVAAERVAVAARQTSIER